MISWELRLLYHPLCRLDEALLRTTDIQIIRNTGIYCKRPEGKSRVRYHPGLDNPSVSARGALFELQQPKCTVICIPSLYLDT